MARVKEPSVGIGTAAINIHVFSHVKLTSALIGFQVRLGDNQTHFFQDCLTPTSPISMEGWALEEMQPHLRTGVHLANLLFMMTTVRKS